jgi:hypothetical protein
METNAQKSVSLEKAVKAGLITNISPVRVNSSGYAYITVINGDKASNLYFGKRSAEKVAVGQQLGAEELKNAQFVLSTNAAGEQRLKISLNGESSYTDLTSIFNAGPTAEEQEVLRVLKAEMVAKETSAPVKDMSSFEN